MSNLLPHERILVALDYDNADDAVRLSHLLAGKIGGVKVGLELVNSAGFDIFSRLADAGAARIFYDAKFHDIPNTVAGAVKAAAKRGVWMVNVHAGGGSAMLKAATDAAHSGDHVPLLIGVTILTSLDEAALHTDLRVPGTVADQVTHLAALCQSAGLDGVVASPLELAAIRRTCGPDFVTVIPGIRPAGVATHDQARVATPGATILAGASYLVIGRAITGASDPAAAADAISQEIRSVL
ncbi:MAG: orotidine-5'-phosphate decarboxylase [Akkermansiaceae bacterium]|nr:orotidine-5'-phosphate decarboxylase [Armatimonadota bacterium]